MKCPTCAEHTPDAWQPLFAQSHGGGANHSLKAREKESDNRAVRHVSFDWMHCANNACKELVIRLHEQYRDFGDAAPGAPKTVSWFAYPRGSAAGRIDPLVPEHFRRDYEEAALILPISPRMSVVLSRRILADLLEQYAKLTDFALQKRIDAFVADETRPYQLRQNLGFLVEMGNFGAHTQTNDQAEVIDVAEHEAEWTLGLVLRLFDYFIVTPERDRLTREAFDQKRQEAKRQPIVQPPEDEQT